MPLARDLVEQIRRRDVTEADLETMALFALDAAASALAGRNSDPGARLIAWADANARRPDGALCGASAYAFLCGALTHILEMDDLHRASVVHPGCVVVPAVLAQCAQDPGRWDGRDALTAMLHGFEATTRVGMAVGPAHYRIWHNTATCGPFGSAMAAACLLGLDDAGAVHALGNAGTQSSGLWEFLDTGAMSKHLHAGHAAQAGLLAGQLAATGFTGPATILEGERGFFAATCPDGEPERLLADADAPWQVHLTSIKPWPSCRHTHPAIAAALELRDKLAARGASPDDITAITAETYPAALDLCDRRAPDSVYAAKFSLQHTISGALTFGEVTFESFEAPARERASGLAAKVTPKVADDFTAAYPIDWGCGLTATLRDNSSIAAECRRAKGDPGAMLTRDEMVAKARMLLAHGEVAEPDALIDGVLAMADGSPVPELALLN